MGLCLHLREVIGHEGDAYVQQWGIADDFLLDDAHLQPFVVVD